MDGKNNAFVRDFETIFKIKASLEENENQQILRQCYAPDNDKDIATSDKVEYIDEKRED
jgi:hypothetical protein